MRKKPFEDSGLDIVELSLERPSQWSGARFPLLVEARFGSSDVVDEDNGLSVEFGIKRAFLRLDLSGCRIALNSRSYEGIRPSEITQNVATHESREQQRQGQLHGSLRGTFSSFSIEGGAGGDAKVAVMQREEAVGDRIRVHRAVTALPGQRWEIMAMQEDYLKGLYIRADHALCEIEIDKKHYTVTASAELRAISDNIELLNVRYRGGTTGAVLKNIVAIFSGDEYQVDVKKQVIKLLIAKSLRKERDLIEIMRKQIGE